MLYAPGFLWKRTILSEREYSCENTFFVLVCEPLAHECLPCKYTLSDAPSIMIAAKPPTFIADAMLGRLARWLRILGYDVVYEPCISDDGLIARAVQEHRIILTMDRKLTERASAKYSLLIRSPSYKEQLKQVVTSYNIDCTSGIFTRCLLCNTRLNRIDKEQVKDKVPPYVYSTQNAFDICQQCNRLYWSGTHRVKMLEMLDEILK